MNLFGLSFVTPALLGLVVVAPVIILAYLNKSPRKEKIVSSLLLLRLLPKAPSIKQKIKIPPLFWLELLTLILVAILAAYPTFSSKGERVAIILDNSLSMRARQAATNRFSLAINEVKNWVDLQGGNDNFTLYTSSPRLRRTSGELLSSGELKAALQNARESSSPDYIDESISELISSQRYDKIFVVSDKEPAFSKAGNVFPVDGRMVGELVSNASLSNLRLDKKNNNLVSAVAFYGPRSAAAKIQAYLGGNLIAETPITLEPRRVVEARLNIPRSVSGLARVEIVLSDPDSIYIDNTGYIFLGGEQSKNFLLVTLEDPAGNSLGLDKLSAETLHPEDYALLTEEKAKEYRLIVFHGVCPEIAPPTPSLFISPPIGCKLFPGVKEVENPTISSWKTESPLTSYLDFSLLKLNRTVLFSPSNWAESVLNAEQGMVLLAGEKDGIRYAACGFELLPFEGRTTPTASVLTLNLFSWLTAGGDFQDTVRTGSQIHLLQKGVGKTSENDWWQLTLPAGEIVRSDTWSYNDGPPRADAPGLYVVKNAKGEKKFVVNAFHPDESETDVRNRYEASYIVEQSESKPPESDLWRSVLAFILMLLAIEMAIRLFQTLRQKVPAPERTPLQGSNPRMRNV